MLDRSRTRVRTDFERGEATSALVWLAVAGLLSVLIEVVYLGTVITLPGVGEVPLPWPVLAAALFNAVLTRTALLWRPPRLVALLPLAAWCAGYALFFFGPEVTAQLLVENNILAIALLGAGLAGGFWPVFRVK